MKQDSGRQSLGEGERERGGQASKERERTERQSVGWVRCEGCVLLCVALSLCVRCACVRVRVACVSVCVSVN